MDKLLQILGENSSFTTAELALMLDEPEDYIKAQIKEYENAGIIKGYRALINWEKVQNSGVTAIIELKVAPKKETGFDEVAQRIMEFAEVESVYLMAAGGYDLQITVKGQSIQEVATFVSTRLSTIDGVLSTATHFMLKRYKEDGVILENKNQESDQRSIVW
jgi:DNA-binding Lrp family transcriptional regulator